MSYFDRRSFRAQWEKDTSIEFVNRERRQYRHYCPYARQFAVWCEDLVGGVTDNPTLMSVKHAKLLLLDRYFEWRSFAPRSHRDRTSTRQGHICIFQVFVDAYDALKIIELSLTPPPLLSASVHSPRRSRPEIHGILIGEEDDDGEDELEPEYGR